MKRMLKWLSLMALVCVFLSACDAFGGSSETNYGYKYPQSCVGGKAVWWTEREGCIDAEPIVKETEIPGKVQARYTVHLKLGKDKFKGIDTYFDRIAQAGYDNDPYNEGFDSVEEWMDGSKEDPVNNWLIQDDFETLEDHSVRANTIWRISLTGQRSNGTLTIEYLYTHFSE